MEQQSELIRLKHEHESIREQMKQLVTLVYELDSLANSITPESSPLKLDFIKTRLWNFAQTLEFLKKGTSEHVKRDELFLFPIAQGGLTEEFDRQHRKMEEEICQAISMVESPGLSYAELRQACSDLKTAYHRINVLLVNHTYHEDPINELIIEEAGN